MRPILLAGLISLSSAAAAQFSGSGGGTSAAEFLKLGVDARGAALGGAQSAAADEASALHWNPAGLARIPGRSLSLMRAAHLGGGAYNYLAYGQKLGEAGAFGVGVQHFSPGDIVGTDASGVDTGRLVPYDVAATLGYARALPDKSGLVLGASVKLIRSKIERTAQTAAADMGALSPELAGGRLRLAAVLSNLGGSLKYESAREPLPASLILGAAFRPFEAWSLTLDARAPRHERVSASFGSEYWVLSGESARLAARLGVDTRTIGDVTGITGVSGGVGLGYGRARFDYSLTPYGSLGQAHRLSLALGF